MTRSPIFVSPSGRAMPSLREASIWSIYEHMAQVTLRQPLPPLNQRGR